MTPRAAFHLFLVAFVVACTPPSPPPPAQPPPQKPPTDQAAAEVSPAAAIDQALRAGIPGYVGLALGAEGEVRLTLSGKGDPAAATSLAQQAWTSALTERGLNSEGHLRFQIVPSALGPEDLTAAFTAMRDVLTLPKTVFLDLDETCGCITVAISDPAAESAVMTFATQHGLPAGVVRTVLSAPLVRMARLRDRFRPTIGGIEITRSGMICSLGLPVFSFEQSRMGFLTASHCTMRQGGADATVFFQEQPIEGDSITVGGPEPETPRPIGYEIIDPALFDQAADPACPTGRRCRYSDTAFAIYADLDLGHIGRIARPNNVCNGTSTVCSLDMDRSTDDIRITAASTSGAFVGDTINKVGRTTGWTSGAVTNTCVNSNVAEDDSSDSGMTLLCQFIVSAASDHGDSGSAAFMFNAATGAASMEGILWGGPATNDRFAYSPVSGIRRELGEFVYNQQGLASPFFSDGRFYTSDLADEIAVVVERNAVPADQVEFVLIAGQGLHGRKEIVLAEGANPPASGGGRWTLSVGSNGATQRNGLYLYQLPGGHLEFRKQNQSNQIVEVSRVPIDRIEPGSRITFTWERD